MPNLRGNADSTRGVALLDVDDRFVAANSDFCFAVGYSREALLRLTLTDVTDTEPMVAGARSHARGEASDAGLRSLIGSDGAHINACITDASAHEGGKQRRFVAIVDRQSPAARVTSDRTDSKRDCDDRIRRLSRRFRAGREQEHLDTARRIHDLFGPSLTSLTVDLARIAERIPACDARSVERARAMAVEIDRLIPAIRDIASDHRPPILDDLGLMAALEWLVERADKQNRFRCVLRTDLQDLTLDPARAMNVYRIAQEALTNAIRHAGAALVEISVRVEDGEIVVEVSDDGRGITHPEADAPDTLGLIGMQEYAADLGGTLTVANGLRRGVKVSLRAPMIP